ncbi:hypothetical protein [Ralstonia syzygii]|uniref:Uncharacterized protein n=1 Tax=Ralstonia syzygii R24 TaxID=907261 RepID=G3AAY4_9RALS|nr:hypothetical protein [Ralstonia syzygii]CCA87210.1 conserved hypothetical protein [Ralstonia syzygii R24]
MKDLHNESLHDAELTQLSIDRDNWSVCLGFRLENGVRRTVQLDGVVAIRGEDLILQNVVSRVLRSTRGDLSKDTIDRLLTWVTSLSDAHSWLTDEHKGELLAECENGTLELVVFEPSAGTEIVAVCKSFVVT